MSPRGARKRIPGLKWKLVFVCFNWTLKNCNAFYRRQLIPVRSDWLSLVKYQGWLAVKLAGYYLEQFTPIPLRWIRFIIFKIIRGRVFNIR